MTDGEVRIKKGDGVFLPILVMNRLESIWGPDAAEFKYVPLILLMPFTDITISLFLVPHGGRIYLEQQIQSRVYGEASSRSWEGRDPVSGTVLPS